MAKEAILKTDEGTILYPRTISSVVLDAETGEPIGKVYTKNIKADDEKKWLRVEGEEGKRYFVALTELSIPDAPTITITKYDVVTGNCDIIVNDHPTGATMEYSTDDGFTWKAIPINNIIQYATGYTNELDNDPIILTILLRAEKNGEVSGVREVSINIYPKVARGSVSVTRNNNNNDYSTSATITIEKSPTIGAETKYQVDGGDWLVLNQDSIKFTRTATTDPGYYKVQATKDGYEPSYESSNSKITLGKKKFYYGRGPAILSGEGAIMALTGGGVIEKDTMAGNYEITSTEKGLYTWFCGTGTLTSVTSGGFAVPMENVKSIDGYNCYRSRSPVQVIGTDTFKVS